MAATALVEGHFVNSQYREWDGFTDSRTGQVVKEGRKLLLNVFTPHDNDLVEVTADKESIEGIRESVRSATFGVVVRVTCAVNKYGKYIGYNAELVNSGKA